jgi:hypothetical protein
VTGAFHTKSAKATGMHKIKNDDADQKRVKGLLTDIQSMNREGHIAKAAQNQQNLLQGLGNDALSQIPKHLMSITNTGVVSLAPLIKQVLKTKDKVQLQQCLLANDKGIIAQTVRDLNANIAFDWLQECGAMLFTHPARAVQISEWIKQILTFHCSYILANPQLKQSLEPLYKNCQERLTSHQSLLKVRRLSCGLLLMGIMIHIEVNKL